MTGVAAWFMWDAAKVPASVPKSPDLAVREAQLRVDVIRNILAVGAGAGGLIALFLALRRQYVKERVDHADQEYKNRTAEDSKHDATERRVTDLYAKAAEQLGSDKAAVRLAALYALERVGQDNDEHRQTIVDLVCAYLRMPYELPESDDIGYVGGRRDVEDEERHHELQVRLAAQKILTKHLTYSKIIVQDGRLHCPVGSDKFWPEIQVDLSGAVLTHVNFRKCAVESINLDRTIIRGRSYFDDFLCSGYGQFSKTSFGDNARFSGATFVGGFLCAEAEFAGSADFSKAKLYLGHFVEVTFKGAVSFKVAHAFVWEFRGSRVYVNASGSHGWPKGFAVGDADKFGFGEIVQVTEIGWWEEEAEDGNPVKEPRLKLVLPEQSTSRGSVDRQPRPDPGPP
ncbi:pentapeptide repeat-containing protein [Micromonospora sp. ZYX-F-536]|uniref:pentapeptide repeat-containing protein n=1 Tax=Micromonospora sp. ZYX-F-536 TaxID=3457629 RepID=UPI0040407FB1